MKYRGVNIVLSHHYPLFGQGHVLTSKLCFVKYVKDKTEGEVHIKSTTEVILHEIAHAKQIEALGFFTFYLHLVKEYVFDGYKNSILEYMARQQSAIINKDLEADLTQHCITNKISWY